MDLFGNQHGGGPGYLAQLAQAFVAGQAPVMHASPRAYDEYLKAYSVAMLPGRARDNVSYGGKVIMPPSALANLTNLDLEYPYMFHLRNPANAAASTHAGVLEFIAQEGHVHLPQWMMKTLRLAEGDPIRITGTSLPKGKLVKIQPQSTIFLEISDPKAVLEQALRNYSALTTGDIIEISYNSMIFGILIMETKPGGEGISLLDTDLEVDFAAPLGYVEPEKPKVAAPATMASKLKIDLNSSTPGSSRPTSSLAGGFSNVTVANAVSKDGETWESFKGKGETLGGRRTKGKGIGHRPSEHVPEDSKIIRTDKQRIVTNSSLESDTKVPAALNLPFGQLFFGYNIVAGPPPPAVDVSSESLTNTQTVPTFVGTGNTLTGRLAPRQPQAPKGSDKGKAKAEKPPKEWGNNGQSLGAKTIPSARHGQTQKKKPKERSPTPDWGVDDDEVIEIDSD